MEKQFNHDGAPAWKNNLTMTELRHGKIIDHDGAPAGKSI